MQQSRTILVVDDDVPSVEFITEVLSDEGYLIRTAYDSDGALAAIERYHLDAVLLDLRMPGLSGADVFRHIQSRSRASIPIILMTADDRSIQKLLAQGVKFILLKPFDITTLLACLAGALTQPERTRQQVAPPASDSEKSRAAQEAHICA